MVSCHVKLVCRSMMVTWCIMEISFLRNGRIDEIIVLFRVDDVRH